MFEPAQQRRFLGAGGVAQAEIRHRQAQQIVTGYLRRYHTSNDIGVAVELRPKLFDQGGLTGADFAGDDDEAFLLGQAIDQMRDRPAVPAGAEEESAVGCQQEWQAGKVVVFVENGVRSKGFRDAEDQHVLVEAEDGRRGLPLQQ